MAHHSTQIHGSSQNQTPMIEIPEKLLASPNFKSLAAMTNLNLDKLDSLDQILDVIFQNIESFDQIKSLYKSDRRLGRYIEKNIVIFTDDIELPTRQMAIKDGIEGLNIDKFTFYQVSSSHSLSNRIFNNPRYKFYLIYFIGNENFQTRSHSKIWQFLQRSNKVQNAYLYNKLDISSTVKTNLYNISEESSSSHSSQFPSRPPSSLSFASRSSSQTSLSSEFSTPSPLQSIPASPVSSPTTTQFQLNNKSPNRSRSNSRNSNSGKNSKKSKICDLGPNGSGLSERQQMQQEACVIGFFIFVIGLMIFLISRG